MRAGWRSSGDRRRGLSGQLREQPAFLVEELLGPVATHPVLEPAELIRALPDSSKGYLVRAPRSLDRDAVDLAGARPAFRRPEHEHRPARPLELAALPRCLPGSAQSRRGSGRARRRTVRAPPATSRHRSHRDEDRRPAVALEQRLELALGDPREHGRVRDLLAVQVQDRQDRTVAARVEELVRVPARGERSGLRLAVADDAGDQQIRIVEGCPESVHERIAELATLVDRARRLRCCVARDPPGKENCRKSSRSPSSPCADVRVQLAVGPLQVGVRDVCRSAVTRPGDEDRIEVARPDRAVQMRVDKVQPATVPKWPSSRGFTCSGCSGSRSSGLSSR